MKKTRYKIKMRDGSDQEIEGEVVNGVWGIDKRTIGKGSGYYLTHVPTGTLITNSRTKRSLMEIANLEDLMDEDDMTKVGRAVIAFWDERGWKD